MALSDAQKLQLSATAVDGISGFASSYAQSQALRAQGEFQKQQNDINARFARLKAADALRRGEKTAKQIADEGGKTEGAQRAALAAQGVVVDSGSALDVVQDTQRLTAQDVSAVRSNSWREAFGFEQEASNSTAAGVMAQTAASNTANSTLLTGGLLGVKSGLKGYADTQK